MLKPEKACSEWQSVFAAAYELGGEVETESCTVVPEICLGIVPSYI